MARCLAAVQLGVERWANADERRQGRAFLRGVRVALWCVSMRMTPSQLEAELRAELFGTAPPQLPCRANTKCAMRGAHEVLENG
ncbi:Uncharacterised protein [Pseudomonas putida]|nr:Uncharacterised protein [Pseudomonas putida]